MTMVQFRLFYLYSIIVSITVLLGSTADTNNSLELIVLRYKALAYSEVSANPNSLYEFRFCYCPMAVSISLDRPDLNARCTCSSRNVGKTAIHSPAIFAASCLHSGTTNANQFGKCLTVTLTSNNLNINDGILFVEMLLDNRPITHPRWQSMPLAKTRQSVQLQCATSMTSCASDCQLCRSGHVDFTYIVVGKFGTTDEKSNDAKTVGNNRIVNGGGGTKQLPPASIVPSRQLATSRGLEWNLINTIKRRLEEAHKHDHHAISEHKFDIDEFKRQLTGLHNAYRRIHDADDLHTDTKAEHAAQAYANRLASTHSCLKHEGDGRYGESLYYYATNEMPNSQELAKSVVDSFYIESRGYNYRRFKKLDYFKTGHFTQLVWKSTTSIGIGVALTPFDGRKQLGCHPTFVGTLIYVVIKYDPPGNVQSEWHYVNNVLPPDDTV